MARPVLPAVWRVLVARYGRVCPIPLASPRPFGPGHFRGPTPRQTTHAYKNP
jgi:hypothetical protein